MSTTLGTFAHLTATSDGARLASSEDIRLSFTLFHGRPADDAVIGDRRGRTVRSILEGILGSDEFEAVVFATICQVRAPGALLALPEDADLKAVLLMDLNIDGSALSAAKTPVEVMGLVYESPLVRQILRRAYGRRRLADYGEGLRQLLECLAADRRAEQLLDERLQRRADRLTILERHDLGVGASDLIMLTSPDPWILAEIDAGLRSEPLVRLTLKLRRDDGESARPKVYLDNGEGVSEESALELHPAGADRYMALICNVSQAERLRLDVDDREGVVQIDSLALEAVGPGVLQTMVAAAARNPADAPYALRLAERLGHRIFAPRSAGDLRDVVLLSRELNDGCFPASPGYGSYLAWVARYATPDEADYRRMNEIAAGFAIRPCFSFVMPTYNTPIDLLRRCINSMLSQTYRDFEICIADDNSTTPEVADYLERLAASLPRVKLKRRPRNGHISEASNTALGLATGDFVVLVDHDDEIPDYALFTIASYINARPDAAILFSDEDKINIDGRRSDPYFKSEFNEFLMYGHNMISHLGVYRRSLIESVGGFRKGLEGSQDYDLFFRCYEQIRPEQVIHIPHVLYHWRMIPGSTAVSADQKDYAIVAAQAAINGHFERMGKPLRSVPGRAAGNTAVVPSRFVDTSVSVIIPTRNGLDVLKPCIDSVRVTTDPATVEIVIADNGSNEPETLAYLCELRKTGIVKVVSLPGEFNFSAINNQAVRHSSGEILCFLNNDAEVLSPTWLERARALLAIPEIGGVGARLIYPDGTVQHMGVTLGMGPHRVAGHPHNGIPKSHPGYFSKGFLIAEFSAVTAACLFVRRSDFESVGGFDESLTVAYNDVDLCLRLRSRGLKIICDPDAELTHKESRTRGSDQEGERARRLDSEAEAMRNRWKDLLVTDPYFSLNHSLDSASFLAAAPPRQKMPWENDFPCGLT